MLPDLKRTWKVEALPENDTEINKLVLRFSVLGFHGLEFGLAKTEDRNDTVYKFCIWL